MLVKAEDEHAIDNAAFTGLFYANSGRLGSTTALSYGCQ